MLVALVTVATLLLAREVAADADPFVQRLASATGQPYERALAVTVAIRAAVQDDASRAILGALAVKESSLRVAVERCEIAGDANHAWGLFQEHATGPRRERLCAGGAVEQAKFAALHLRAVGGTTIDERIARYAGRDAGHRIVRERAALARELGAEL